MASRSTAQVRCEVGARYSGAAVGPIQLSMWLDGIALALLLSFAFFGARRGAIAAGMGLLTLAAAYASAIAFAGDLGPMAAASIGAPELLETPLGGTLAFAAAFVVMALISAVIRRRSAVPKGYRRATRDRFLGGVFGAVRGGFVVLLLSYLALWVDALRVTGADPILPSLESSMAAGLTEEVVEAGVEAALGDGPSGRVMARIASRPGATLGDIQTLLENPHLLAVQHDRLFWSHVEVGSVDAALNQASFWNLSHDPELRDRFADIGLIDSVAAYDAPAFREAARDMLEEVGPRIRGLRNDPALLELLEDPELVAMLEEGDTLGLVAHPAIRDLVTRVAAQPLPE